MSEVLQLLPIHFDLYQWARHLGLSNKGICVSQAWQTNVNSAHLITELEAVSLKRRVDADRIVYKDVRKALSLVCSTEWFSLEDCKSQILFCGCASLCFELAINIPRCWIMSYFSASKKLHIAESAKPCCQRRKLTQVVFYCDHHGTVSARAEMRHSMPLSKPRKDTKGNFGNHWRRWRVLSSLPTGKADFFSRWYWSTVRWAVKKGWESLTLEFCYSPYSFGE